MESSYTKILFSLENKNLIFFLCILFIEGLNDVDFSKNCLPLMGLTIVKRQKLTEVWIKNL